MSLELLSWPNIKDRVHEWQSARSYFNIDLKSDFQPADRPRGFFVGDEMLFEIGAILYESGQVAISLAAL